MLVKYTLFPLTRLLVNRTDGAPRYPDTRYPDQMVICPDNEDSRTVGTFSKNIKTHSKSGLKTQKVVYLGF